MFKSEKAHIRKVLREEAQRGIELSGISDQIQELREKIERLDCSYNQETFGDKIFDDALKNVRNGDIDGTLRCIRTMQVMKDDNRIKILNWAAALRKEIIRQKRDDVWQKCLKALFDMHNLVEFSYDQYVDVYRYHLPITQASSLLQHYVRRRRMRQIGKVPERWLTYNKQSGEEFARMAGAVCPDSVYGIKLSEIKPKKDMVVKPMSSSGSKGVFIIRDLDDILSVEEHVSYSSWDEVKANLQKSIDSKRFADLFECQQCIYMDKKQRKPANDLKFFVFYGEVGAVMEVARYSDKTWWWWNADSSKILAHKDVIPVGLEPCGFTENMLQQVKELSMQIPAPFLRIDYLLGEDKLYFVEFCTFQGYGIPTLERLNPTYDRRFGTMYLQAEMRIVNDLLAGKKFETINRFNKIYDK